MLKRIVKTNVKDYVIIFELECGHTVGEKNWGQKVPKRKKCTKCSQL